MATKTWMDVLVAGQAFGILFRDPVPGHRRRKRRGKENKAVKTAEGKD